MTSGDTGPPPRTAIGASGLLGGLGVEVRSLLASDHPVSFSLVVLATSEDAWDRGARGSEGCPGSAWSEWTETTETRQVASRFESNGPERAAIRVVGVAGPPVACVRRA